MNREQTAKLTRYVKAACPQQAIDDYTPDVWHDFVRDLAIDDCFAAVRAIIARQPFIAVGEIVTEVKRIRNGRLIDSDKVIPAADPDDPRAYIAALRSNYRDLADGVTPSRALNAGTLAIGSGDTEAGGSETVRAILAEFEAKRQEAKARQRAQRDAERAATRVYIDAMERLLALDDLGADCLGKASEALFSPAEAVAGFPAAAQATGVTDHQKIVILAARLAEAL